MKKRTPFGEIEIVDAHAHLFSGKFVDTLISQSEQLKNDPNPLARVAEITGWNIPPSDPVDLGKIWIDELDKKEVFASVLIASVPNDEMSIAAVCAAYTDRIIGAFMFDPTKPDADTRVKTSLDDLKLRIVCLFPAMHHYSISECEGVRAVVSATAERPGTAVFVHCGALSVGARKKLGLPSIFDMTKSNPLDIYKLAAEFPKANFIIPHFGAGMFREAMMLADLCPNVYIDTSSSNSWMKYESYPLDLQTVFKRALAVVGPKRLLFGTDSSFFPRGWNQSVFDVQIKALSEIGVSNDDAVDIMGGNMKRLLQY